MPDPLLTITTTDPDRARLGTVHVIGNAPFVVVAVEEVGSGWRCAVAEQGSEAARAALVERARQDAIAAASTLLGLNDEGAASYGQMMAVAARALLDVRVMRRRFREEHAPTFATGGHPEARPAVLRRTTGRMRSAVDPTPNPDGSHTVTLAFDTPSALPRPRRSGRDLFVAPWLRRAPDEDDGSPD